MVTDLEHLAAQWCADRANEIAGHILYTANDFLIDDRPAFRAYLADTIKRHEAAVALDQNLAGHLFNPSSTARKLLEPHILREPAPTDPKDARIDSVRLNERLGL